MKSSEYLSNVDVSVSLVNCTDQSCKLHEGEIDRLYGDIIKSLNMAANDCIPRRKTGTRQQLPGWTEIVKESCTRLQGATLNSGALMVSPDMDSV